MSFSRGSHVLRTLDKSLSPALVLVGRLLTLTGWLSCRAVKAHLRRGAARIELGKIDEAVEDLTAATGEQPPPLVVSTQFRGSCRFLSDVRMPKRRPWVVAGTFVYQLPACCLWSSADCVHGFPLVALDPEAKEVKELLAKARKIQSDRARKTTKVAIEEADDDESEQQQQEAEEEGLSDAMPQLSPTTVLSPLSSPAAADKQAASAAASDKPGGAVPNPKELAAQHKDHGNRLFGEGKLTEASRVAQRLLCPRDPAATATALADRGE